MKTSHFGPLVAAFSLATLLSACIPDAPLPVDTSDTALTGIWSYSMELPRTDSLLYEEGNLEPIGERSIEMKRNMLMLIEEQDDMGTITMRFCDGTSESDPLPIESDKVILTGDDEPGMEQVFTMTFDRDAKTLSGAITDSGESITLAGKRISSAVTFENPLLASMTLSVFVEANKPVITESMHIPIGCYMATAQTVKTKLFNDGEIESPEDVLRANTLFADGTDTDGNRLQVQISQQTSEDINQELITIVYLNEESNTGANLFFRVLEGGIDIDGSSAAVNVAVDDPQGNAATVEFSLEYAQ